MRPISLYALIDRRRRRSRAASLSFRRRAGRAALGCGVIGLLLVSAALLAAGLGYARLVDGLPSLDRLPALFDAEQGLMMQPTQLYDRSGQHLLLTLENPGITRRYRTVDPNLPQSFSPQLVRVTLAVVDPAYWSGPGASLTRLTDPLPATIAERLADELLLWQEPPGLRRALRMRLLAAQMVARYGHVQVLEWYLNSAYYGHLAFGADSAARLYLEKPASRLTLAEAALLHAALQAPALNPLDAPAAALERQRDLLDQLLARGAIGPEEHRQALDEELALARPIGPEASPAAAFSRLVVNSLAEQFGMTRLERGGLRVITTLDYSLQLELTCLARTQLARLTGQPDAVRLPDGSACTAARLLPTLPPAEQPLPATLTASAVVLDPRDGQVLALLGDATTRGEGLSLQPRPPGSLLSPFVALAGFARGMGPATLAWDIPASLADDLSERPNPDGAFHGPVRLRQALANDYLAAQAQVLAQVGPANAWRLAAALGVTALADETGPDLLYGGGRVSPLELAQAYAVFAAQGQRAGQRGPGGELRPALVLYVEDLEGRLLLDASRAETQPAVSPPLAYLVHHVLSDAAARWPSLGFPNALEIGRPAGARIGQVEGQQSLWAAGYTPQRVALFWLGLPQEDDPPLNAPMVAGMWHALMQHAHRGLPAVDWPVPPGISRVDVCDPSGLLPTASCPAVVSEVFLAGSEPAAADPLYQVFNVNRETGRLATVFTPPALVEARTFFVPPAQAREWAAAASLPVPPGEYDAIQPPEPSADVAIASPEPFAFVRGELALRGTAAGESFRFYQLQVGQGLNPTAWLQVGEDGAQPVRDGVLGVWDTTGQEGLYAVRLLVVRQDQSVESTAIQVTVDNTPPLARIPYPLNQQVFQAGRDQAIIFRAEAGDAFGVQRLAWLVDGRPAGESRQAPYVLTWQAAPGEHTLQVIAFDQAGNEGRSEMVTFTVE